MLLQNERVFVLDIRSDSSSTSTNSHNKSCLQSVSETVIHRRIIQLFKSRDEFQYIDLNVRTSRGLSGTTRVDISNCLAHMRHKGKTLRKLTADIDYMDPSVHEFVTLHCLQFQHISIMSNPLEQACLSPGLAMSIRHALTLNKQCTKILELQCALSETTSEIMADAMKTANDLESLKIHLLTGRSTYVCGVLEGLQGKSKLKKLQLQNVSADVAESLAQMLGHRGCRVQELHLNYPWEGDEEADTTFVYNTACLCAALAEIRNTSITKLILDGIRFSTATREKKEDGTVAISIVGSGNTVSLIQAFQKLETLSIAAPEMPHLDFLSLPRAELPQHLKHCYFPCLLPNVEEARNLVERVPTIIDVPDYASDCVVQHLLDWRKVASSLPKHASVWPHVIYHTCQKMQDSALSRRRQANMVYTLLQEYHGLHKKGELVFSSSSENDKSGQEAMTCKKSSYYDEEEKKEDAVDLFGTFDVFGEQGEDGDY